MPHQIRERITDQVEDGERDRGGDGGVPLPSLVETIELPESQSHADGGNHHRRDGRDIVWVVQHARATPRAVALGAPNGDEIAIAAGLAAGEKVVIGDTSDLTDGAPITETTP